MIVVGFWVLCLFGFGLGFVNLVVLGFGFCFEFVGVLLLVCSCRLLGWCVYLYLTWVSGLCFVILLLGCVGRVFGLGFEFPGVGII